MQEKTKESFSPPPDNLTKFPQGSVRELLSLATPLFLILFAGCLLNFLERIWFAHFSLQALEASVNAIYLLRIFQMPCIALAMMAQAYVGYHNGAKELTAIGPCIWQMIWFSLFSMVITIPLSFFAQDLFFKGLEVEKTAAPYFCILVFCNFLYPLGSALSSFYLGRGKTTFTVLATLGAYLLNAGLDIALIFGIDPWIPAMGLKGAAFATLLSQGVFCLLLFALFINKSNQAAFGTQQWKFQPKVFWNYISPGIPRACGRLLLFAFWAANTHIMAVRGGDYQLILSIGGTIGMFVMFLSDGILQAFVVLLSNALGARNYSRLKKFLHSGLWVIFSVGCLLTIPLIVFPDSVLMLFSLKTVLTTSLKWSLIWMWMHTIALMLNALLLAVLISHKDTLYVLIASLIAAAFGYMTTFIGMNYFNLSTDKFWLLTVVNMVFCTCLYAWRISRNRWFQPDFNSTESIQGQNNP